MTAKKNRVCFVSPKAYPIFNLDIESVFGGAEVDTYMIATELAKDDAFDVSFLVADYGQPEEEIRENVRLLKSVDFNQNPLTGAIKIWKALRKADADVYLMKTASPGVPLVQSFCQKYRRRFIYKNAAQGECDGRYLKTHPILGRLFVRSLRKAAQVITQNQQDHENFKTHFGIDSIVIPNGHRIPDISVNDKASILWVGRSAAVKGPRRFIELARALPGESFVMICPRATGDADYDHLKAAASKVNNLEFIERVSFRDIDRYFEQAKVFVNTSDAEGFPNTFIQACKTGTAILSYAVNPDGFLARYECGVDCQGQASQLRESLAALLAGQDYVNIGKNGRRYAEKNHNISRIIQTYKHLLGEQEK
jgi:glycosyltransferase involved in cell wall biosynthesis